MKKRCLAVLMSVLMLLGMIPVSFAAADIERHWAKTYIEYLDREGVINPNATTGLYEPDKQMTRAEFMRYINRAFHFTETAAISYTDVAANAWYYETVQIATRYGYINGVGANRMDPQGLVTREQAAVIIGRLFKTTPNEVAPADLTFSDHGQISSWAAGYIQPAVERGILTGYEDGTFRPAAVVTRAEVAKILYFYLGTSLSVRGKAYTGADLKADTDNVTISENCSLSDATITGDLYISEGLGADAVTLTNVKVGGAIIHAGGTLTMVNTTSENMIVSSPMGRLMQSTATGTTAIGSTSVQTSAMLHERGLTAGGTGYTTVSVNGAERISLTLDAELTDLMLEGEATVSTTAEAAVYRLTANQPASVTGYGAVYQADIRSNGVSFASSVELSGYTLGNGVMATIGGRIVSASRPAGVVPTTIEVDRSNLAALGSGVSISVPASRRIISVTCDGQLLNASRAYEQTDSGVRLLTEYLGTLAHGDHTLVLAFYDGTRENIAIHVTDPAAASMRFDRYYRASDFRDLSVQLDEVREQSDVSRVVLGLSSVDFSFNSTTRALVLRRGTLAQLPEGTYTVTVELASGAARSFDLVVSDSAPDGTDMAVAEYNTFAPTEARMTLPLDGRTVRQVTAENNGVVQALVEQTDYTVSQTALTLTRKALEEFRRSSGYVAFTITLSDNTVHTLVVDYI